MIESEKMYGFHGHFSSGNAMLFFGGGFKARLRLWQNGPANIRWCRSKTRCRCTDVHATIYKALGIPADTNYVTEGRPFYVTKDGKGQADRRDAGVGVKVADKFCPLPCK